MSGVGCHLSSAIVILCFALVPLRNALLEILECHERALAIREQQQQKAAVVVANPTHSSLLQLARLLRKMVAQREEETTDSVDPSAVFAMFEQQCNPYELGDATKALSMLLKNMRSLVPSSVVTADLNENIAKDNQIMEAKRQYQQLCDCLFGGSMQQELIGKRSVPSADEADDGQPGGPVVRVRRKRKRLPLMCPFPLDGIGCDSVASALQSAMKATVVRGYNWESGSSSEFEEWMEPCVSKDDNTSITDESEWKTTKQTTFVESSLPAFLLFHLQRFVVGYNGCMKALEQILDVPFELSVEGLAPNDNSSDGNNYQDTIPHTTRYELVGGILHADVGDKEEEDYEGGHYIAICRQDNNSSSSSNRNDWCLVNDEKVSVVSQTVALDLLAGKPDALPSGSPMRGTLLVYSQQSRDGENCNALSLQASFRASLQQATESGESIFPTKLAADQQRPEDLVGKRLRVRWAKGKFYPGKVAAYDEATGKHSVKYDDGDVRQYTLLKKTIKWEDD